MKTIHSILMSIMFIFTAVMCEAQTAYEKKVYAECKASFKQFYGKELKVSQVKQLSRADIAKFVKTQDPADLKNLPCEISGVILPNPGNIDPSPVAVEFVGTGVSGKAHSGTYRLIYIPYDAKGKCTPNRGGFYVDNSKNDNGCEKSPACQGRIGNGTPSCTHTCQCKMLCNGIGDCTMCP